MFFIGSIAAIGGVELWRRRKIRQAVSDAEYGGRLLLAATRVAQNARSLLNVERILEVAVGEVVPAFEVEHCIVLVEGDSGAPATVKHYPEDGQERADASLLKDFDECHAALVAGGVDHYLRNGGTNQTPDGWGEQSKKSLLGVPVAHDGRFLGTLMVRSDNPARIWRDNELQALLSIAHQVWQSVTQAWLFEEKQRESHTDALTGCLNRRAFEEHLDSNLKSATGSRPLSLVMVDIDHFKMINDQYGHDVGDAVLRRISFILREEAEATGVAARWGGEEFILQLPAIGVDEAAALAESIRRRIELEKVFEIDRSITASFGVATFPLHARSREPLLKAVDQALYKAKGEGRNRICVSPELTDLAKLPNEVI
jgi:diguanylate cyclase (GGDEF)-like protein